MANLLIATGVLTDPITPTIVNEEAALPGTNLAKPEPGDRWRTASAGAASAAWDLGAVTACNLAYLGYTNAEAGTTWQVEASNAPGFSPLVHDSGSMTLLAAPNAGFTRASGIYYMDPSISARYWRISVDATGHSAGYFEAGRAFVAAAWQPSENMRHGMELRLRDNSVFPRSLDGVGFPNPLGRWRELSFRIENLGLAEMLDDALALDLNRGSRKDVLIVPDPAFSAKQRMQTAIYGVMSPLAPIRNQVLGYYAKQYRIEEWELP